MNQKAGRSSSLYRSLQQYTLSAEFRHTLAWHQYAIPKKEARLGPELALRIHGSIRDSQDRGWNRRVYTRKSIHSRRGETARNFVLGRNKVGLCDRHSRCMIVRNHIVGRDSGSKIAVHRLYRTWALEFGISMSRLREK